MNKNFLVEQYKNDKNKYLSQLFTNNFQTIKKFLKKLSN